MNSSALPAPLDERERRYAELSARLAALPRPIALSLNDNRTILISLRGDFRRGLRLSIHRELLDHPAALADLPRWAAAGGRAASPAIRAALDQAGRALRARERQSQPPLELEPLGGPLDLREAFERVHAAWFLGLPLPEVGWSRTVRKPNRRHLRFASYRRRPTPLVLVSPRLDQPWVARAFVDFVLYHELCHHAQACDPKRGETAHSARFRAWERRFPGCELLLRWERENLDRFLV
jgi:hypothetical protein